MVRDHTLPISFLTLDRKQDEKSCILWTLGRCERVAPSPKQGMIAQSIALLNGVCQIQPKKIKTENKIMIKTKQAERVERSKDLKELSVQSNMCADLIAQGGIYAMQGMAETSHKNTFMFNVHRADSHKI